MFYSQICTLPELLAFVLNTLKRKRKRNVLAHGYNFLSLAHEDRDANQFKFQGDVTQSAAYIHGSDLWKKVIMRLGTDLTRYLLESCSVFVAVPPSCVFQVCGIPAYDRVSMSTNSPGIYLQPRPRKHKGAHVRRYRHVSTLKRRRKGEASTPSESGISTDKSIKKRKRRRDIDLKEEEEVISSGKRRRVGEQERTQEVQQVYNEFMEGGHIVEPTLSMKQLGNVTNDSKQPAEMQTTILPLEGGPSWRSGIFPPLPPSQSFIRTRGLLYGGRGMRGFLLNQKMKTADGCRRLQGQDLLRIIFFEGLSHLNKLEKKPKKLPRRFFKMVPLFSQLLHRHRSCPYARLLQRMCPLLGKKDAGKEGELNSLLPQHCGPYRVYLFVIECLLAVVPQELWGSDHNRLLFFVRVRDFLRSGKFEKLSVAELLWKMSVNDCDWLKISITGDRLLGTVFFFDLLHVIGLN